MRVVSVHFDLLKKVKSDAVSFRGVFLDVGIGPRLLTPELIAGETQNPQTRFSVLAIQSLQLSVVGFGETSLSGDVDDDADAIAAKIAQIHGRAIDIIGRKVVNRSGAVFRHRQV